MTSKSRRKAESAKPRCLKRNRPRMGRNKFHAASTPRSHLNLGWNTFSRGQRLKSASVRPTGRAEETGGQVNECETSMIVLLGKSIYGTFCSLRITLPFLSTLIGLILWVIKQLVCFTSDLSQCSTNSFIRKNNLLWRHCPLLPQSPFGNSVSARECLHSWYDAY